MGFTVSGEVAKAARLFNGVVFGVAFHILSTDSIIVGLRFKSL